MSTIVANSCNIVVWIWQFLWSWEGSEQGRTGQGRPLPPCVQLFSCQSNSILVKINLYLIWGRPITECCCNSLKVALICAEKKMLSLPKSSEVCFDEYPLFPTEESKHQMSTKKVGFKVFVKVNAKRNKQRMWLDQVQKQLPNVLNPNRYIIAIIDNQ